MSELLKEFYFFGLFGLKGHLNFLLFFNILLKYHILDSLWSSSFVNVLLIGQLFIILIR